jgi:RNA polymerase sigma-70 factor (ECF subfamily)
LDHELDAIVAGDAEAFGRWAAGAEGELRASLRPFAHWVDSEAVLQEALLRVWQVAPRFVRDGRPNGLLRLAVTTARNLARSEARRFRPESAELDALERSLSTEAQVEPASPDPLLRKLIGFCREKLGGKPAEALRLRLDSAGQERDEALAARLGMTLNTFLQNFSRARRLLGACLKSKGVDLEVELR